MSDRDTAEPISFVPGGPVGPGQPVVLERGERIVPAKSLMVLHHWQRLRAHRDSTHSDDCWKWHPACAMALILGVD